MKNRGINIKHFIVICISSEKKPFLIRDDRKSAISKNSISTLNLVQFFCFIVTQYFKEIQLDQTDFFNKVSVTKLHLFSSMTLLKNYRYWT